LCSGRGSGRICAGMLPKPRPPQISLEPMAQGLVAEMEEAARGNI
jgi:hypothetical protein